jgi:hypothetical protein
LAWRLGRSKIVLSFAQAIVDLPEVALDVGDVHTYRRI